MRRNDYRRDLKKLSDKDLLNRIDIMEEFCLARGDGDYLRKANYGIELLKKRGYPEEKITEMINENYHRRKSISDPLRQLNKLKISERRCEYV